MNPVCRNGADESCGCAHIYQPTFRYTRQSRWPLVMVLAISLLQSVSLPNRPNQWRWTTVSFRLPLCYSPFSPSNQKHFKFHLSAYKQKVHYTFYQVEYKFGGMYRSCPVHIFAVFSLPISKSLHYDSIVTK